MMSVLTLYQHHLVKPTHQFSLKYIKYAWRRGATGFRNESKESTSERKDFAVNLPSFNDHRIAYQHKTTFQLLRAVFILKLCSYNIVVNNSLQLMSKAEWILGGKIFEKLMKPTLYEHFIGGETWPEVRACVNRWREEENVSSMLVASLEEDITEVDTSNIRETQYDKNTEVILDCLQFIHTFAQPVKKMQLKLTGIISPNLVMKLGVLYERCGDEGEKAAYIRHVASLMRGDAGEEAGGGVAAAAALRSALTAHERAHLRTSLARLQRICQVAQQCDVDIYVDAEWTYINEGIRWLTNAMVYLYNTGDRAAVRNTYQCYLK